MLRPTIARLPVALAEVARRVAQHLEGAGYRAWIVGGAVRDLALGREPNDVDLASAARPEELERLFDSTTAVGKAFGTVVVRIDGIAVQVTTFRAESGYDDARRPTHVSFSNRLEEDAERRDFTCNALYLDPLRDELCDPAGGLDDLAAGRLRCVGEAGARFAEDGLRLLRMARLAAQLGLRVEEDTQAAARAAADALRGVSPERVLAELGRVGEGERPGSAFRLLLELGLLQRLPGLAALEPDGLPARVRALERLAACGHSALASAERNAVTFATLFRPSDPGALAASRDAFAALRPSRALAGRLAHAWALEPELLRVLQELERGTARASSWVPLVRDEAFDGVLILGCAWHPDLHARAVAELRRLRTDTPRERLFPTPWVTSAELERAGIPRGPRWARLLAEAEALQLDGVLTGLEAARAWLAGQTR